MSENSEQNKKSILDLPVDYLYDLFNNYLDFNSKLVTEKVCKQWQQIIRISFDSKRCLIITDYDLHESRFKGLNLSNKKISVVKMVSFHLIERTEIKDKKFISMVLKKYTNLETLCICLKFTKCTNKYLDLISKFCSSSLNNLRIETSECSISNRTLIISHEEVLQMAEKLPNLNYFYIDFVLLFIEEQSLKTMLKEWHNIQTIIFHTPCFRGCVYNSEVEHLSTEFTGDYFSEMSPLMTKLELPGNILNLNAIQRIPEKNNLNRLHISRLKLNSIELICNKFPKLTYFGFTLENSINDEDLYQIMENVGKLHLLEQFYIATNSNVSIDCNCIKFLRHCFQLNTLKIDQTLISKSGIDAITRVFPKLQSLQLWTSGRNQTFIHCLTDSIVENLRNLKHLKCLNIRGQRNICDNSIAKIISNCLQLETIDIRTTKAAIITLKVLIEKSDKSVKTTEVFVNETPICRMFGTEVKRYLICRHLLLINEEYDYKINF